MTKSISEVLKAANNISNVEERITFLQNNNSNALLTVLKIAFDSTIKWSLPEGIPHYNASQSTESHGLIHSAAILRKIKYFFEGNGFEGMKAMKREQLFIEFLETLDKDDAGLICYIKENKNVPYRKITKSFVRKCFPELLEDNAEADSEEKH